MLNTRKYQLIFLALATYAHAHTEARHHLIDIQKLNPQIRTHIYYATDDNFTKRAVYPKNAYVYLLDQVAQALNRVQQELKNDGLGLLVWDGYRPVSVQETFWRICPDPNYVADPKKGSRHNRGAAVDVTLVHLQSGKSLNMPTEFDDFSKKAWRDAGQELGVTKEQIANRRKLECVMHAHGFKGLASEWWHFDWQDALDHPEQYPLLCFSFDELAK